MKTTKGHNTTLCRISAGDHHLLMQVPLHFASHTLKHTATQETFLPLKLGIHIILLCIQYSGWSRHLSSAYIVWWSQENPQVCRPQASFANFWEGFVCSMHAWHNFLSWFDSNVLDLWENLIGRTETLHVVIGTVQNDVLVQMDVIPPEGVLSAPCERQACHRCCAVADMPRRPKPWWSLHLSHVCMLKPNVAGWRRVTAAQSNIAPDPISNFTIESNGASLKASLWWRRYRDCAYKELRHVSHADSIIYRPDTLSKSHFCGMTLAIGSGSPETFCPNQWFLVLPELTWFADESVCSRQETACASSAFNTNSQSIRFCWQATTKVN